ncbi:MAG: peptidylprolyl isomerase [Phycisphaerales bacterium]
MNRTCFFAAGLRAALAVCVAGFAGAASAAQSAAAPAADPNAQAQVIVARIGEFEITKDELTQRILQEIRPHEEEFYQEAPAVTAESVLHKILGEKATSMEGRRLGLDQDDQIRRAVSQLEQARIVTKLLETDLGPKLKVEEADVNQVLKSRPTLTREQAKMVALQTQVNQLREKYYAEVAAKRKVTKVTENLAKAAEIHQRLLTQPRQPRAATQYWILNSQLKTDLSDEERALVLATFDGGQYTLKDLLQLLCDFPPPRRPQDLGTPQGIEKLLEMALHGPVLSAEAKSRGYDKDPKLQSELRKLENDRILYKAQEEKLKDVPEPTAEQVKAYFDQDPSRFATNPVLKVDQIWCPDKEAAQKVRSQIDQGADFDAIRKDYSLQKDVSSYSLSPGSEGMFWAGLAKAEPNQVLGPLPGFFGNGVKWRVIKVRETIPAKSQAYSEQIAGSAKWMLFGGQRRQILAQMEKGLLEKYPYEVFSDRIEDLDPLEIAMKQQDK